MAKQLEVSSAARESWIAQTRKAYVALKKDVLKESSQLANAVALSGRIMATFKAHGFVLPKDEAKLKALKSQLLEDCYLGGNTSQSRQAAGESPSETSSTVAAELIDMVQ